MALKLRFQRCCYGLAGRKGEVVVVNKVEFKLAESRSDTVPEKAPANAVSVEIVTKVAMVVSVTRVVSVETQVVLTVMDSSITDAEVGWWNGETEKSLALFAD